MTTAVLAVQGAFVEHERMLERLGEPCVELRQASDLDRPFDRLVLPGGESTVQKKLLAQQGMLERLRKLVAGGMPVLGTCAGLILLATEVDGGSVCLGTLPVTVRRNAYGRQLGSFHTSAQFEGIGTIPMTFIRAPSITGLHESARCLAAVDGGAVAVRSGNQIGLAFHPELDDDTRIHELFLSL